jgi:HlyD family secretion protein
LFAAGAIGVFALFGVLGLWALLTIISGAVMAMGQVSVTDKPKTVQTLDGGVLAEISVRNGDLVRKGEVLARLDPTLLQINLDIAQNRMAAALALRARLEAEQNGVPEVAFDYSELPASILAVALELDTTHAEIGQRNIFTARAEMLQGGRDRMVSALADLDNQVTGITGQIEALEAQLAYVETDVTNVRNLLAKGLARQDRLTDLQRMQASLMGDLAGRRSDLARLSNSRREVELTTLQEERRFHEQVVTDLREVTTDIEELMLEIVTHRAQLERVDIRAPSDGIVHELQVTTLGGVMAPGGTLLDIIPQDTGFDFELRVDPRSINQVREEQVAKVVLSAFDPQTTPQLEGRVRTISPEVIEDRQTGQSFYRVSVDVPLEQLARLPETAVLIPGMPVEAYLQTDDRTVLSYLTAPLRDHLRRAFRE